ncbi:MAG: HAMP domain-containing histidine kinase [Candidatus Binataceae bacterium]|nr:HAMP domain-containing histidine kinase [Candidatus Binataceae bacterium]
MEQFQQPHGNSTVNPVPPAYVGSPKRIDSDDEAIRVLRLSGPVAVTFMLAYLTISQGRNEQIPSLTSDRSAVLAVTVVFFGITWAPIFRRHWRLWTLLVSALVIALFIRISAATGDPVSRFVTILLFPLATASFVRWNPRWQLTMCAVCLLEFAAANYFAPIPDRFLSYRWLGLLAGLSLSQFTAIFLHEYDARVHRNLDQLADAASFRERQMAMLAHDIRNPLSAVTGFVGILEEDQELNESERREMLVRIGLAMQLMDLIVGNVLDYQNIEERRLTPNRRIIDLNLAASEAAHEGQQRAQRKRVKFHTRLHRVPAVECDPLHLGRVLKNLLINAIDRADRGRVILTTAANNGHVRIEVSDSGPALDRETLDRLLERPAKSTVHAWPAIIGMFVARCLVEVNGGRITAESDAREGGLTVIVELPADKS